MPETALIPVQNGVPVHCQNDELDRAALELARASKSPATLRAYRFDFAHFTAWVAEQGLAHPVEPRHVARYLAALVQAKLKASTIERRCAAIAFHYRAAGQDNPCSREIVRATLAGVRNTLGTKPAKKKALTVDLTAKVVRKIRGDDVKSARDRAMILVCFGAALRRSELVALDLADIEFKRRGLMISLAKSKTDQAGKGAKLAIPDGKLKIPEAVRAYLKAAGLMDGDRITGEGPLFRAILKGDRVTERRIDTESFVRMFKARCAAAGLDPTEFSGHSPRRGFATTAGDEGADLRKTAEAMRHSKLETTMGYMEEGDLLNTSVGKLFL
ncbi:site-specific integrase [Methylobacterium sp. D53M]